MNGGIIEKLRIRVLSQHLVDKNGNVKPVASTDLSEEAQDFLMAAIGSLLNRKIAVTNGELSAIGRLLQQQYTIKGLSHKVSTKQHNNNNDDTASSTYSKKGSSRSDFCSSRRSDVAAGSTVSSSMRSNATSNRHLNSSVQGNGPASTTASDLSSNIRQQYINSNNPAAAIINQHETCHLSPVDTVAQETYLSTGVIKPHMVRRLQLLHSDKRFRDAMDEDATQAQQEEQAALLARKEKHGEVAITMKELDDRRREKIEQQRREREEGKRRVKAEVEAVKAEALQRRINKKKDHQRAKDFLVEQQRLRQEALRRQSELDRAKEAELRDFMIRAENEQKEKEREKHSVMKEEVNEYVAFCSQQLKDREERNRLEREEERRLDQEAVQLALEREKVRFGTSKKDGTSRLAFGDLAALGVDTAKPNAGGFTSPLHVLESRDRDRSPKVVRKMLGLREAQDVAAQRYMEIKAAEELKIAEREKRVQEEMRKKEQEKEERNLQDKAKKLAARETLVKSLDVEIDIHHQRAVELQREKERFKKMADEDAAKLSQEQERAIETKYEKRHKFTSDIERQRKADFSRKLLPIQTKIGSSAGL